MQCTNIRAERTIERELKGRSGDCNHVDAVLEVLSAVQPFMSSRAKGRDGSVRRDGEDDTRVAAIHILKSRRYRHGRNGGNERATRWTG